MIDLRSFCTEFAIDETAATAALERPDGESGLPWYVRAFLAVGAWVTAIAIAAFFLVLLDLALDGGGFDSILAVLGALCFAAGVGMLAKRPGGEFRKSFATALAAAGAAMATAGIGSVTEEIWVAVLASLVLAGFVISWAPGAILQLLASGLAVTLIAVALIVEKVPYYLDIAPLFLVAGALLWTRPPRVDMRATAFVLLLMPPALSIFDRLNLWWAAAAGGWGARAVHIALFAWLVSILWRRLTEPGAKAALGVFAAAASAVCLLLPVGGSGALVIMTLAFVLGSRPLALLGVLLQAYFFWQFYYDLAISLLNKSLLLTAVGLVVLGCWWFVAGRRPQGEGA